ncbi:centromere protein M isoform X2 [Vulpes vulpes]|uniref:Centromere protein M n=1 Tax=Vulpes vulpes TaxID=9627 RepID=A0ABM4Z8S4_VULVU
MSVLRPLDKQPGLNTATILLVGTEDALLQQLADAMLKEDCASELKILQNVEESLRHVDATFFLGKVGFLAMGAGQESHCSIHRNTVTKLANTYRSPVFFCDLEALTWRLLCCACWHQARGQSCSPYPTRPHRRLWAPAFQSPDEGTLCWHTPHPHEGLCPLFHAWDCLSQLPGKEPSGPLPPGRWLEVALLHIPAQRPLDPPSPALLAKLCFLWRRGHRLTRPGGCLEVLEAGAVGSCSVRHALDRGMAVTGSGAQSWPHSSASARLWQPVRLL